MNQGLDNPTGRPGDAPAPKRTLAELLERDLQAWRIARAAIENARAR
jgi:hypothetical protein